MAINTYIFGYAADDCSTDDVINWLDSHDKVVTTWHLAFPQVFFLESELSSDDIRDAIRADLPINRFFVSLVPNEDVGQTLSGWLPAATWQFLLRNRRSRTRRSSGYITHTERAFTFAELELRDLGAREIIETINARGKAWMVALKEIEDEIGKFIETLEDAREKSDVANGDKNSENFTIEVRDLTSAFDTLASAIRRLNRKAGRAFGGFLGGIHVLSTLKLKEITAIGSMLSDQLREGESHLYHNRGRIGAYWIAFGDLPSDRSEIAISRSNALRSLMKLDEEYSEGIILLQKVAKELATTQFPDEEKPH